MGNPPWHITIFGQSPTFFTFNVLKDICPGSFDLQGYAILDVDDCVDVTGITEISHIVKIDVAQAQTEPPGWIECCLGNGQVEDESAVIKLTGEVIFHLLEVDADNAAANVKLTVSGRGTVLANTIQIRPELNSGDPARIGGLALWNDSITTNALKIHAGQSDDRRVNLDLDDDMTVRNMTTLARIDLLDPAGGGRVFVDIDPGKVFDVGELFIDGPCILKVSGIATTPAPGQLQTSANEEASDNTCTCLCSE